MQYRPNKYFVDGDNRKGGIVEIVNKRKCEQAVSKCKKLQTFIKAVVERNITVLSKQEYYHVQAECGEIVNASYISNGDDAIADVWVEHNPELFPDTKRGKYQNSLLTDDDINLVFQRIFLII